MHSWFTQKLNEMTALAHYCQYPVLTAHFTLAQKAVDEMYGEHGTDEDCLKQILPMLISQAETGGKIEAADHLKKALAAMERQDSESDNVIPVDFQVSLGLGNGHSA